MRLKDQSRAKEVLESLYSKGRVPNSLLFYGIEGVGKTIASLDYAKGLLCERGEVWGCSQCGSCALVDQIADKILSGEWEDISSYEEKEGKRVFLYLSGEHPDFVFLPPGGSYIRIDQIRAVKEFVFRKPALSERKVVVIDSAEQMNREAANALLKVLEEPPTDTHFILTTSMRDAIIPTILSRTYPVAFSPLEEGAFYDLVGKEDKDLYLRSLGSVSLAQKLTQRADLMSMAKGILEGSPKEFAEVIGKVDVLGVEDKELLLDFVEEALRKALLEKSLDYDKFEVCMDRISEMRAGISRGVKLSVALCLLHAIGR